MCGVNRALISASVFMTLVNEKRLSATLCAAAVLTRKRFSISKVRAPYFQEVLEGSTEVMVPAVAKLVDVAASRYLTRIVLKNFVIGSLYQLSEITLGLAVPCPLKSKAMVVVFGFLSWKVMPPLRVMNTIRPSASASLFISSQTLKLAMEEEVDNA